MEADIKKSRRSFINVLLGIGGAATLGAISYPMVMFLKPPSQSESSQFSVVLEPKLSELNVNDWMIFRFGNRPGLLICSEEDGEKKLYAYSATCTHLNCIVEYQPDENRIFCPCHNGVFDINGNNIAGPPPKPLEKFSVQVINDVIKINREG